MQKQTRLQQQQFHQSIINPYFATVIKMGKFQREVQTLVC